MNNTVKEIVTNALERNLLMQKESPQALIYTICTLDNENPLWNFGLLDECVFMEEETFNGKKPSLDAQCGLRVKVSNCELDLFDGSCPFGYDIRDNALRLQMKLVFWENEETLKIFKALTCFSKFKEVTHTTTKGEHLYQYFIDCGEDANAMATTFIEVLGSVYGVDFEGVKSKQFITDAYTTFIQQQEFATKERLGEALRAYGIPYYKMPCLNCKMHVSKDVIEEIKRLTDEYNNKYSKKRNNYFELLEDRQVLLKKILPYTPSNKVHIPFVSTMITGHNILKSQELEGRIYNLGATTWKK